MFVSEFILSDKLLDAVQDTLLISGDSGPYSAEDLFNAFTNNSIDVSSTNEIESLLNELGRLQDLCDSIDDEGMRLDELHTSLSQQLQYYETAGQRVGQFTEQMSQLIDQINEVEDRMSQLSVEREQLEQQIHEIEQELSEARTRSDID